MKILMIQLLILVFALELYSQKEQDIMPFLPDITGQFTNIRDLTISKAQDEAYFTVQSALGEISVILKTTRVRDKWTQPTIASFSGRFGDLEPFLSPDELRLYFASNRPSDGQLTTPKDYDIWYVQRESRHAAWSEAINLGGPVNSSHNEFYPSVSINNNIYFTSDNPNSKGLDDIYFAEWRGGHYSEPFSLSDSINSAGYEFNAFVAPDESYLIFTAYQREGGRGSGDLYISYNKGDHNWSRSIPLSGDVNSTQMDYCPFVHEGSSTLYFTSRRTDFEGQEAGFKSLEELVLQIGGYKNGLSRIYKVGIDSVLPQHRK